MTKTKWIILATIIVLITGVSFVVDKKQNRQPVACTLEAKICPDGSAVGRTGPMCEFADCPEVIATTTPKGKGTLKGSVTIGPLCPVEYAEKFPDYSCEPTPEIYAEAKVFVYLPDKKTLVRTIIPDKDGKFSITLDPGSYFIDMIHQTMGGTTGVPTTVKIVSGGTITIKLDVDTGLR
jgi:hypothetical protein